MPRLIVWQCQDLFFNRAVIFSNLQQPYLHSCRVFFLSKPRFVFFCMSRCIFQLCKTYFSTMPRFFYEAMTYLKHAAPFFEPAATYFSIAPRCNFRPRRDYLFAMLRLIFRPGRDPFWTMPSVVFRPCNKLFFKHAETYFSILQRPIFWSFYYFPTTPRSTFGYDVNFFITMPWRILRSSRVFLRPCS